MTRQSMRLGALALLPLALVLGRVGWVVSAPNVDATCEQLLDMARAGGEQPGDPEAELCRTVMDQRRSEAGWYRWGKLSRCIARTRSIDEAGRCEAR